MKLISDTKPNLQPKDSHRYCLNGVLEDIIVNEKGTSITIPDIGKIYGSISIDRDSTILFVDNKILLFKDNFVETLAEANFNFQKSIQGVYRIVNGCDNAIYWNDGINPDRYFIYNRPEKFKTNNQFDLNKFRIHPSINFPTLNIEVLNGGNVEPGSYTFVIEHYEYETLVYRSIAHKHLVVDSKSSFKFTIDNEYLNQIYVIKDDICYKIYKKFDSSYTWSGFNVAEGDSYEDLFKILTPLVKYDVSDYMTISDNRLLRQNLKQNEFINLQKYASKIRTKYTTGTSDVSLTPDEVSALGICYIYTNGNISTPYHIPGRPKIDSDSILINQNKVGNVFEGNGMSVQINYTDDNIQFVPSISGITNVSFDGVDENGNNIIVYPIAEGNYFYTSTDGIDGKLSGILKFDNYYYNGYIDGTIILNSYNDFIDVERWLLEDTSFNDEFGYYESEELYENPTNWCNEESYWGVDYEGNELVGNIRYHRIPSRNKIKLFDNNTPVSIGVSFSNIEYPEGIIGHFFVINSPNKGNTTVIDAGPIDLFYKDNPRRLMYDIVEGDEDLPDSIYIKNLSAYRYFNDTDEKPDYICINGNLTVGDIDTKIIDKDDDVGDNYFKNDDGPKLPYEDFELYEKKHNIYSYNLETAKYINVRNSYNIRPLEYKNNISNGNITNNIYVNELDEPLDYKHYYVTFKRNIRPFNNIHSISYRFLSKDNNTFNGNTFISNYNIVNITAINPEATFNINPWLLFSTTPYAIVAAIVALTADDVVKAEYEYISNIWSEGSLNANYRINKFEGSITAYVIDKLTEAYYGKKKIRDSIEKETYKLYSYKQIYNIFSTLPSSFDYCSKCVGCFPNRIIYSEPSFEEQYSDNFRIYKPNNYVDIPSNRGKLIASEYRNGKLLIRCEQGLFMLQTNNQQLNTDSTTIYIGIGDYLSNPVFEPISSNIGYAGQQHKLESCNTEFGLIWSDSREGKIYMFDDSIKELTSNGMYYFFEEYFKLNKIFSNVPYIKPDDFRVSITYDHRNKRIILHKKNYEYINTTIGLRYDNGVFILNGNVLDYDDTEYFVNKSITISYSLLHNTWASFHSYQPRFMFYDSDTFYSNYKNHLWKHNVGGYTNYYNVQHDFIIEFIHNDINTFNPNSIMYYSRTSDDVVSDTFDRCWIYNTKESTGVFDLVYNPLNIGWSNIVKPVIMKDRNYRINQIRDLSNGGPTYRIIHENNIDIEQLNTDYNKPINEQPLFRDKYIHVRLFFNKNKRLETYYKDVFSTKSLR